MNVQYVAYTGNEGPQPPPAEPLDDPVDERDPELGTKSSIEACSSLVCLSPRASTDALLPSFQPDDDADVKSPQLSAVPEHPQRNYPGSMPQFARRLSRSPRPDELYSGAGHASYAGHSPRPGLEVAPSAVHRASDSEQGTHSSPHSPAIIVEDLTSHTKLDRAVAETSQSQLQNTDDREVVKSSMDHLRVTASPTAVSRQPLRDAAANCDSSKVSSLCSVTQVFVVAVQYRR